MTNRQAIYLACLIIAAACFTVLAVFGAVEIAAFLLSKLFGI